MTLKHSHIGAHIEAKAPQTAHAAYVLRLADNAMILGQRLSEMCGHGPEMELDMAMTNISLDLIGQAKLLYEHCLSLENLAASADVLALTRDIGQYRNCHLVAQPNVDFAHIIVRQYLFSTMQDVQYQALCKSSDTDLAAIAEKSLKEIAYHIRFAKAWMLRLGDGTDESHKRTAAALEELWRFTGELFNQDTILEKVIATGLCTDFTKSHTDWQQQIEALLTQAGGLTIPEPGQMIMGAYQGQHGEHLGHILKDMQFMQLRYPGLEW